MEIGTKSVLFGAHQFLIHPWFVALAWWKLYGFPWDPRLWVVFFLHDLGYWGKPNMDGPEGESHVLWAAEVVHTLFDFPFFRTEKEWQSLYTKLGVRSMNWAWFDFCALHSRFWAKQQGSPYSRLCPADKLAVAIEPWWLYLPRANLSGEIHEYMKLAAARNAAGEPLGSKYSTMNLDTKTQKGWFLSTAAYLRAWAYEHKDLKEDTWTPDMKAGNPNG